MSVSSLAWDGYPNTPPNSERYDDSYIYQVIYTSVSKSWLKLSQVPFYKSKDQWGNLRIGSGTAQHTLEYVDGNWEYWGDTGSQAGGFDDILQSTHDIYMDSSLTDVFFSVIRQTPMQETLTQHPPLTLM
ncbi:MAG TPA: hypothetical protein VLZ83_00165, partial [Edaphocola sp.]|nr:hypothetical protein [Edaphocola sp.]